MERIEGQVLEQGQSRERLKKGGGRTFTVLALGCPNHCLFLCPLPLLLRQRVLLLAHSSRCWPEAALRAADEGTMEVCSGGTTVR